MKGRRAATSSIVVLSPPCARPMSQAARWRFRSGTNERTSTPSTAGSVLGSMRGPATAIIRRFGKRRLTAGKALLDKVIRAFPAVKRRGANPGAANRRDADDLIVTLAQPAAQLVPIFQLTALHAEYIAAAEDVVTLGPLPDLWQARTERVGDDVVRPSDEDRAVTDARETLDVADHLRVVIGAKQRVTLAELGHWEPADEVCQPHVRCPFELRVLV